MEEEEKRVTTTKRGREGKRGKKRRVIAEEKWSTRTTTDCDRWLTTNKKYGQVAAIVEGIKRREVWREKERSKNNF